MFLNIPEFNMSITKELCKRLLAVRIYKVAGLTTIEKWVCQLCFAGENDFFRINRERDFVREALFASLEEAEAFRQRIEAEIAEFNS